MFGYPHLDGFFTNEGWDPYLVYVDGKIAGFVLVVKDMIEELNEEAYSIAEFFIMKKSVEIIGMDLFKGLEIKTVKTLCLNCFLLGLIYFAVLFMKSTL